MHRNLENRLIVPTRSGIRRGARNSRRAHAYWSSRRENFSAGGLSRTRMATTYEVIPRNKFRKSTATAERELRNFPAWISFAHTSRKGPSLFTLNEIQEISKNSANAIWRARRSTGASSLSCSPHSSSVIKLSFALIKKTKKYFLNTGVHLYRSLKKY